MTVPASSPPVDPAGPAATLSGRPVIPAGPRRTPVRRGSVALVLVALLGTLGAGGLAVLRAGPDGTDVRDLAPGQCYVQTDTVSDAGRPIPYGRDAPCLESAPRVIAVVPLPLGPFPGPEGFAQVVSERCGGEQNQVIVPTADTWVDGDRTVACLHLP